MKSKDQLPPAMLAKIDGQPDAIRFLRALHDAGLDHHFDDGAVDCLYGNKLVDRLCAEFIDGQIADCYRAWEAAGADLSTDCPIGFMLALMENPEAALTGEFEAYCKHEGLTLRCAEEMLHEDITLEQRRWVSDFVLRWDAMLATA